MAILPVLTVPDPRLRHKAVPVERVDDAVRRLMDDMVDTMNAHDGCGLASIQVGDSRSVVVMQLADEGPLYKMANPKVVWCSKETKEFNAGCLSVPEIYVPVARAFEVEVTYLDYNNDMRTLRCSDKLAHCILHEIDHLEGIIMVDYLSPFKRSRAIKKSQKLAVQEPLPA